MHSDPIPDETVRESKCNRLHKNKTDLSENKIPELFPAYRIMRITFETCVKFCSSVATYEYV